ncbi:hypothetical protein QAD02_002663 [Eretmocerus hayati]|uniref:Uncharacterized protein n=1 Tax=Eretmocerus hayati TaxID=131215 RepID=A0ACC2NM60_9HYME|nr:hypothetical protein QAD02_002663 [Eretmocerus hayati]
MTLGKLQEFRNREIREDVGIEVFADEGIDGFPNQSANNLAAVVVPSVSQNVPGESGDVARAGPPKQQAEEQVNENFDGIAVDEQNNRENVVQYSEETQRRSDVMRPNSDAEIAAGGVTTIDKLVKDWDSFLYYKIILYKYVLPEIYSFQCAHLLPELM